MNRLFSCLSLGFLCWLAPFAAAHAQGGEVYRCVENGKTTILTEPCPTQAKSERIATDQVSEDAIRASTEMWAHEKEEANRMEQARLQREAADAALRRELARERAVDPPPEPERERVGVYVPVPVYAPYAPFRQQTTWPPTRPNTPGNARPGMTGTLRPNPPGTVQSGNGRFSAGQRAPFTANRPARVQLRQDQEPRR